MKAVYPQSPASSLSSAFAGRNISDLKPRVLPSRNRTVTQRLGEIVSTETTRQSSSGRAVDPLSCVNTIIVRA
jgi:hypothetical protein